MPSTREVSEFVVRISEDWSERTDEAIGSIPAAGADVTRLADDRRALSGVIDASRLHRLSRMPCIADLIEGASYVVDDGGRHLRARTRRPSAVQSRRVLGTRVRCSSHPVDLLDLPDLDRPSSMRTGDDEIAAFMAACDEVECDCDECVLPHPQRRPIPWASRAGYLVVAALGAAEIVLAARFGVAHGRHHALAQACLSSLLFGLAASAALGLGKLPIVRHACSASALIVTVLACVMWDQGVVAFQVVCGVAAFLIAGYTGETLDDL